MHHLGDAGVPHLDDAGTCEKAFKFKNLIFRLLMIYREEPGRAVAGEAAPGEQAPTGADWPGFFLSARFDFEMSFGRLGNASARATREWG